MKQGRDSQSAPVQGVERLWILKSVENILETSNTLLTGPQAMSIKPTVQGKRDPARRRVIERTFALSTWL